MKPPPHETPEGASSDSGFASSSGSGSSSESASGCAFDLSTYPTAPGVYLMRDAAGKVIYIGKAKNLRQRLRSYFRDSGDGRLQIEFLRKRIAAVETIVTANETEALLLENTLIKDHKPRYNIRLRDDKTYISLRLDLGHEWPRLHRVRKRPAGDTKALYFGPYSSSSAVRETMRFLLAHFPLRSCSDSMLSNRQRPCLLHQIGRCCAPCVKPVAREEYQAHVDGTILFLKGRRAEVLALLRQRMEAHSEAMEFEKAAALRDRLRALDETVEAGERVVSHRLFDRDAVGLTRDQGRAAFAVLRYRQGKLVESRTFDVPDVDLDDGELLGQFLSQYYDGTRETPRDILLTADPADPELAASLLGQQRGGAVRLRAPKRGVKRRLVEMAEQNARAWIDRAPGTERGPESVLAALRDKLHLPAPPRRLECFDISNIQGSMAVGSMVCFQDGRPSKADYRHFVIRTVEGANDFAMMREVLHRRYRRLLDEERPLPDLVLIDGGKGQLGVAVAVFEDLGLGARVALAAIAKSKLKPGPAGRRTDPKLRTEERVFLPGRKNPVSFRRGDPALGLLQQARDEAHRFGVAFHRQLRSKANLRSSLDQLPGIGKTRRQALLRHFGSVARLRQATREEIEAVPRIPKTVAETLYRFLHPTQSDLFDPALDNPLGLSSEIENETGNDAGIADVGWVSESRPDEATPDNRPRPDDGDLFTRLDE